MSRKALMSYAVVLCDILRNSYPVKNLFLYSECFIDSKKCIEKYRKAMLFSCSFKDKFVEVYV